MTDQRCENCRFYEPDDVCVIAGECRRMPPQVLANIKEPNNPDLWFYPSVRVVDWCGEWQGKEGEKQHGIAANS